MPFRWLFEDGQAPEACLDQLGYEEWLEFVFQHPAPKKGAERWYSAEGWENYYYKDSLLQLRRLTRLMNEPELLLATYSVDQIKQGFWCFVSAFELADLLEDESIDFESRRACIQAIERLYAKIFRRKGFEKIAFMFWDPLTYSFSSTFGRPRNEDHARVQDAMFESLEKILTHEERICFIGALHGLGHLRHERGVQAIRDALARRSETLDAQDHAYALSCIRGDMDAGPPPRLA
jgi:hypothetical protein